MSEFWVFLLLLLTVGSIFATTFVQHLWSERRAEAIRADLLAARKEDLDRLEQVRNSDWQRFEDLRREEREHAEETRKGERKRAMLDREAQQVQTFLDVAQVQAHGWYDAILWKKVDEALLESVGRFHKEMSTSLSTVIKACFVLGIDTKLATDVELHMNGLSHMALSCLKTPDIQSDFDRAGVLWREMMMSIGRLQRALVEIAP